MDEVIDQHYPALNLWLWFQWVLASALGMGLGVVLIHGGSWVLEITGNDALDDLFATLAVFPAIGFGVGLFQALVFRKRFRSIGWWVLICTSGQLMARYLDWLYCCFFRKITGI